MLKLVPKIVKGQAALINQLAAIGQKQVSVVEKSKTLYDTLETVQSKLESLRIFRERFST